MTILSRLDGQRLARGVVLTQPDATATPCYPSRPDLVCNLCRRHRIGLPQWNRKHVVIDASVVRMDRCELFLARPAAVFHNEAAERESLAA